MKLNTVIKITALAVIAAFAAMSCGPEVELTGVDWGAVNAGSNSEKNTSSGNGRDTRFDADTFTVKVFVPPMKSEAGTAGSWVAGGLSSSSFQTDPDTNPLRDTIEIEFPNDSDFLKKNLTGDSLLKALKEFLSFHNYTNPEYDGTGWSHLGKVSTLSDPLDYVLAEAPHPQRSGNLVYLKFTAKPKDTSNVIMKIDGTKYTYDNGNKMDISDRGRPGKDPLYEDVWQVITVTPTADPVGTWSFPTTYAQPGNIGWSLSLSTLSFPAEVVGSGRIRSIQENKGLEVTDIAIASLGLSGTPSDGTSETNGVIEALYQTVADQILASGTFKVQTYDSATKKWNDAAGAIEYHGANAIAGKRYRGNFYLGSFKYNDLEPVRVVWAGNNNQPIITADEWNGVKQWIKIYSAATSPEGDSKHEYGRKTVYTDISMIYTIPESPHLRFTAGTKYLSSEVYSQDPFGKNVIIDITFGGILYGSNTPATYYWLNEYDLKTITDNFKIAYYSGDNKGPSGAFENHSDVLYIPIKAVSYEKVGRDNGMNTMRVTLDPNYKAGTGGNKVFYVSPEITFSDGKSTFGSATNWQNNFWGTIDAGSSW
jgi:hypothetical protein